MILGLSILVFSAIVGFWSYWCILIFSNFWNSRLLYLTSLFLQAVLRLFWASRFVYSRCYLISAVAQASLSYQLYRISCQASLIWISRWNFSGRYHSKCLMSADSLVPFNVQRSETELFQETACYFRFSFAIYEGGCPTLNQTPVELSMPILGSTLTGKLF